MMTSSVEWGDVPGWFEAIGTTGALFATLYIILHDRWIQRRREVAPAAMGVGLGRVSDDDVSFVFEAAKPFWADVRVYMILRVVVRGHSEPLSIGVFINLDGKIASAGYRLQADIVKGCETFLTAESKIAYFFTDARGDRWFRGPERYARLLRVTPFRDRKAERLETALREECEAQDQYHVPVNGDDGVRWVRTDRSNPPHGFESTAS